MKGNIYPNKGGYVVRFGRDLSKWFKSKAEAERFLTGVRYEVDKGKFDLRDYAKGKPLAFSKLSKKYVDHKEQIVKPKSLANIKNHISKAKDFYGDTNIKSIGYAEIEDFLYSLKVSQKTRANAKSCLHDFFTWLKKRRVITPQQFPEFPEINFELSWRNIVDIETQQKIVAEVRRISYHINLKIWLGIKWLCVYIGMRPGEMMDLKEKDINLGIGALIIPHPKEKDPKLIPLLDEDIELLNAIPSGFPDLYFFRHTASRNRYGVKPGQRFGKDYLYVWWKRACKNLGIEGVDLYGGTRHSTTTALSRAGVTVDEIMDGSFHKTNKAFARYCQSKQNRAKVVYQRAADLQQIYNHTGTSKNVKLLKFKYKNGAEGRT